MVTWAPTLGAHKALKHRAKAKGIARGFDPACIASRQFIIQAVRELRRSPYPCHSWSISAEVWLPWAVSPFFTFDHKRLFRWALKYEQVISSRTQVLLQSRASDIQPTALSCDTKSHRLMSPSFPGSSQLPGSGQYTPADVAMCEFCVFPDRSARVSVFCWAGSSRPTQSPAPEDHA